MKHSLHIIIFVILTPVFCSRSFAQDMDEILMKHLEATNFEQRTKVSQIEMKGRSIPDDTTKAIPYEVLINFPDTYEVNYYVRGNKQSIQCEKDSCYSIHRDKTDSVVTELSAGGIDRIWMKEAINRGYLFYNQEYLADLKLLKNSVIKDHEFFRLEYSCDKYIITYHLGVNDYFVHQTDYLFNDSTLVKVVSSKFKKINGLVFPVQKEVYYNNELSSRIVFTSVEVR